MKLGKGFKYVVVLGMVAAISVAPVTRAIAAVSAEETTANTSETTAEEAEAARQEAIARAYDAIIQEGKKPENRTVAGVKSETDGLYLAKKVKGVAMNPSVKKGDEYVKVGDTDKKKSYAAVATADAVAQSLNGTVGPCINVFYGTKSGKEFVRTTEGSAGILSIGIPDNFKTEGATYALVGVYAGGQFKIFENVSEDPSVITAAVDEASSVDVMYALIKY
ncbi:MAG: hypothetical protein IJP92_04470 [Lachnospiraceae bacterium]|nr:hypothetical protein [Lachnospiraceae bacterium]